MGSLILGGLRASKPLRRRILPNVVHMLLIQRSLVAGSRDGWKPTEPNCRKDNKPVANVTRSSWFPSLGGQTFAEKWNSNPIVFHKYPATPATAKAEVSMNIKKRPCCRVSVWAGAW